MYLYFTKDSQTNFKTINNMPHFLDRLTKLSYEAKSLYAMLVGYIKVNRSHNQNKVGKIVKHEYGMYKVVDGNNVYVESARSTIAGIMGKAMGTVRKYIKELRLHGLLEDIRVGQGNMNKIFLKYPIDAEYTYTDDVSKPKDKFEYLESENRQEKSDEEAATSTPLESPKGDTLIQVGTIISQLTDDCLSDRDCKNLLNLAHGDTINDKLDDIQRAVANCYGKTPKKSYYRMVCNTLEKRHHEQKPKEQNKETHAKKIKKVKNGFELDIYSHNWDLDELETQATNYMKKTLRDDIRE